MIRRCIHRSAIVFTDLVRHGCLQPPGRRIPCAIHQYEELHRLAMQSAAVTSPHFMGRRLPRHGRRRMRRKGAPHGRACFRSPPVLPARRRKALRGVRLAVRRRLSFASRSCRRDFHRCFVCACGVCGRDGNGLQSVLWLARDFCAQFEFPRWLWLLVFCLKLFCSLSFKASCSRC